MSCQSLFCPKIIVARSKLETFKTETCPRLKKPVSVAKRQLIMFFGFGNVLPLQIWDSFWNINKSISVSRKSNIAPLWPFFDALSRSRPKIYLLNKTKTMTSKLFPSLGYPQVLSFITNSNHFSSYKVKLQLHMRNKVPMVLRCFYDKSCHSGLWLQLREREESHSVLPQFSSM